MKINIIDTLEIQRKILSSPKETWSNQIRYELMAPFEKMWTTINVPMKPKMPGGYDVIMASSMLGLFDIEGNATEYNERLNRLINEDVLSTVKSTFKTCLERFRLNGRELTEPEVIEVGVFLGNYNNQQFIELNNGYTGFGGIPGYVILLISPTQFNLKRIAPLTAHEFHHNIRLSFEPWKNDITLGEYLVLEGLAESFAGELYGHDLLGPWVDTIDQEELEYSIEVIKPVINLTGFDTIRSYVFGDKFADKFGFPKVGLSHCAGYAVGFHLVQTYLKQTRSTIFEATFIDSREIIKKSLII